MTTRGDFLLLSYTTTVVRMKSPNVMCVVVISAGFSVVFMFWYVCICVPNNVLMLFCKQCKITHTHTHPHSTQHTAHSAQRYIQTANATAQHSVTAVGYTRVLVGQTNRKGIWPYFPGPINPNTALFAVLAALWSLPSAVSHRLLFGSPKTHARESNKVGSNWDNRAWNLPIRAHSI
jgi:hypothetical protein